MLSISLVFSRAKVLIFSYVCVCVYVFYVDDMDSQRHTMGMTATLFNRFSCWKFVTDSKMKDTGFTCLHNTNALLYCKQSYTVYLFEMWRQGWSFSWISCWNMFVTHKYVLCVWCITLGDFFSFVYSKLMREREK